MVNYFNFGLIIIQVLTKAQNPGVAIFTLIGSQLLGYGFAGLLQDILVKPTKCFWPTNSEWLANYHPGDSLMIFLSVGCQLVPSAAL